MEGGCRLKSLQPDRFIQVVSVAAKCGEGCHMHMLLVAASRGNAAAVQMMLVSSGDEALTPSATGTTAWMVAAQHGHDGAADHQPGSDHGRASCVPCVARAHS